VGAPCTALQEEAAGAPCTRLPSARPLRARSFVGAPCSCRQENHALRCGHHACRNPCPA
jgi:hypothetical protein